MTKHSDKFKLVPENEKFKSSHILPRKKLKLFIILIAVTLIVLILYTSRRNTFQIGNLSNHVMKFYDDSQVISVNTDRESDIEENDEANNDNEEDQIEENYQNVTKNVLFWTKFFNNPDWYTGKDDAGEEVLKSVNCPVTNCFFTHNKKLLKDITQFDAIAFHGPEYRRDPLPTIRSPHQLYIFVSLESPTAVLDDLRQYRNFYNLTMTYRRDSDIEMDYGKVLDLETHEVIAPSSHPKWKQPTEDFYDEEIAEIIGKKKKPVAWFVSNCYTRSRRIALVNKIKELIDVDVYGRCGNLTCKVDAQECLDMLSTDYKFYLSFENSLCKDYVTEKIYRPLTQYVIPIVFNGGNTSLYAPPKSYINANDFSNVDDLVKYMKYLMENPKEYIKYFWWKKHYYIKSHPVYQYTLCELCKKLHNKTFMHTQHLYADIQSWYSDKMCNQNAHIKF